MTARLGRLVTVLLGPLWVRTFRDPFREGHLRLGNLSRTEKQLARAGLVMLFLLLGSVLFADVWRSGTLLQMSGSRNELSFAPEGLVPVTLLGLMLGWALLVWGALDASPWVRVAMAVVFHATCATLDVAGFGSGLGTWILDHVDLLFRVGYIGVPAVLLASAALHPLLRSRPRARTVVTAVLRALVLAALVVQFGSLVWAQYDGERHGLSNLVPGLVDGSIDNINGILVPLIFVAAVAVIDFALDVSTSLTEPARVLQRRWLLVLLVVVLALKILLHVVLRWDSWTATVTYQPVAFTRTLVAVALLALVVAAVTRFPASDDYQLAKERAMYGASFVLAAVNVLSLLVVGIGIAVFTELHSDRGVVINDNIPYTWLGTQGVAILSALAVAVGIWLMRRSAGGFGDELGSALVVVGAWCLSIFTLSSFDVLLGFTYPAVDVAVTVGVLVTLLLRWRTLSAAALVSLITLLVFSWLVMSRGDYISFLGSLIGLPAILVVVFGVLLTLASGSAFASEGSRRLPAEARPLLFVGYLLLSVVILHWVEVTHEQGQDEFSLAGFYAIGLPLAFWLAGRRIMARPDPVQEPSAPQD